MFIYILNLLHDGLKKKEKNIYNSHVFDIMRDTRYISELGGIKKQFDFGLIADRIVSVVEIFAKYDLEFKDCFSILERLLQNKEKLWILESLYNSYPCKKINNNPLSIINIIIYDIFHKYKMGKINYQIA